jgi:uncharacterized RDD family membrane protein YckC
MTQPPPAPPPAAPQPAVQGPSGPRANFGQRLVAYLIDVIIYVVALLILVAIAAAISESLAIIVYIIGFLGSIVYFAYFEGSPSGQTLGKKVMKIRVIDFNTGGPIGFGRGLLRWVGRLVSGFLCYLGYLWMLWDREKQTWHDKIATTVVVPESAYPVEKWPG